MNEQDKTTISDPSTDVEVNRMVAEGGKDVTSVGDTKPVSGYIGVSAKQITLVAHAARVELAKLFKQPLKPAQVALLQRITERAVKFQVVNRTPATTDKERKKRDLDRKNINTQLGEFVVAGQVLTAKRFWKGIDVVIEQLSGFIFGAVMSAV